MDVWELFSVLAASYSQTSELLSVWLWKWYLSVVLISISMITNDIECPFF